MQGVRTPTFRPTVWPAEPPGPPSVTRYRLDRVPGVQGLQVTQTLGSFELPPDFVFRELLDRVPATTTQIVDLVADWGLASGVGERTFEYLAAERMPWLQRELEEWGQTPRMVPLLHPEAVQAHLGALRVLSRHLLAYLENRGDDAVVEAWQEPWGEPTESISDAWWKWERYVNRGLAAFTVHVRAEPLVPAAGRLTQPTPNLYNACCLQLANYLAGDTPVLRCANVRCGAPFTRHRGRAEHPEYAQHRSRGVRYCSHLCAKAQSERDRRRRRAQETREP